MKTIYFLGFLAAACSLNPIYGQNTKESHVEVKVVAPNTNCQSSPGEQVKVLLFGDSTMRVTCNQPGNIKSSVCIDVKSTDGKMDIFVREEGKGGQRVQLDLKKMEKEIEKLVSSSRFNEEELDKLIRSYIPDLEKLGDIGFTLDKRMELLDIEMEKLDKEMEDLDNLEALISIGSMDTVLNEITVSEDGKTIHKIIVVNCSVNVSDLNEKDWKKIAENEGGTKSNTLQVDRLDFYPNPSDGKFNVKFESPQKGDLYVRVTDMNGKLVYQERIPSFSGSYSKPFDLTAAGKGVYILQLTIGAQSHYKKLIID